MLFVRMSGVELGYELNHRVSCEMNIFAWHRYLPYASCPNENTYVREWNKTVFDSYEIPYPTFLWTIYQSFCCAPSSNLFIWNLISGSPMSQKQSGNSFVSLPDTLQHFSTTYSDRLCISDICSKSLLSWFQGYFIDSRVGIRLFMIRVHAYGWRKCGEIPKTWVLNCTQIY